MARGWESKNVEAQQADRESSRQAQRPMTPAEQQRAQRRIALDLARARASADLERATHPAHRAMLTAALADIDQQLAALDQPPSDPGR